MIYLSFSNNPFRLINEEDILRIHAYVSRVEDRLKGLLSDSRNSIVPPSLSWILTGCDVNKDIQIDDNNSMAQLTSINIQIKSAIGVFRAYVKQIDDKAFYMVEESLTPNESVSTAFETLRNNVKIDEDSLSL